MAKIIVSQKRYIPIKKLRSILNYNENTGNLYWKDRPLSMFKSKRAHSIWNKRYSGKSALAYKDGKGYLMGAIFDKSYKAHRVAWAIHHGFWPEEIDHINGNKSDNRIINLRSVTHAENMRNQKIFSTNKTGFSGLQFNIRLNGWIVRIGGEWIGIYKTKDEAVTMRKKAIIKLGFSEYHGVKIEAARAAGKETK